MWPPAKISELSLTVERYHLAFGYFLNDFGFVGLTTVGKELDRRIAIEFFTGYR